MAKALALQHGDSNLRTSLEGDGFSRRPDTNLLAVARIVFRNKL